MLDYLKRFLIAGIMAVCVSLLFFGGKPQAQGLESVNDWIWPTEGVISDTFGTRFGHHKGIDIASNLNTSIVSVDDGVVSKSYYSDTYGHVVFIKHDNNLETVYAHLNKRLVQEGERVTKGKIIGRMGNTGKSSGVHLHFEVHKSEWTYDKENAINPSFALGEFEVGKVVQAFDVEDAQYVVKNLEPIQDKTTVHIVKEGETLWSIAQRYSTSIESLQSMNTLSGYYIYEKQELQVPALNSNTYVVKDGDTLSKISIETKLPIETIKKYNSLNTDFIYPQQVINLPKNSNN
jgi:murein DD-endopeptidase MepM/ murein hydrolase activator NlpD